MGFPTDIAPPTSDMGLRIEANKIQPLTLSPKCFAIVCRKRILSTAVRDRWTGAAGLGLTIGGVPVSGSYGAAEVTKANYARQRHREGRPGSRRRGIRSVSPREGSVFTLRDDTISKQSSVRPGNGFAWVKGTKTGSQAWPGIAARLVSLSIKIVGLAGEEETSSEGSQWT